MKNIEIDGVAVMYNDELAKGIYRVSDNNAVKRNCDALRIDVEKPIKGNHIATKVSKIDDFGILTQCGIEDAIQFIFSRSATQKDVDELIKEMPKEAHGLLMQAYQMSKPLMLDDLDGFMKVFG